MDVNVSLFWLQAGGLLVQVAILLALTVIIRRLRRTAAGQSDLLLAAQDLLEKVVEENIKR